MTVLLLRWSNSSYPFLIINLIVFLFPQIRNIIFTISRQKVLITGVKCQYQRIPKKKQDYYFVCNLTCIISNLKMLQQQLLQRNKSQTAKQRLFRLFHTILHNYSLHPNIYYVLLVLEIMQFISYAVHTSFQNLWATPITSIIQNILSFTDLSGLWVRAGGLALLMFASLGLLLNLVALLFVVYEVSKHSAKLDDQNVVLIKFLTTYYVFIKTLLFLPMMLSYFAFISPDKYNLTISMQASLAVISVLGIILLLANSSLVILFFRNNSPFSKLPFSSSVNYQQELRFAIKFLLAFYGSLAKPGTVIPLAFAISYFAITACFLYLTLTTPGLIRYPYNRIYQNGILLAFWSVFCSLLQMVFSNADWIGIILWIIGIITAPICWSSIQTKREMHLLSLSYKALDKSSECLAYNYYCIALTTQRANPYNLTVLEGILNLHIQSCNKPVELCSCSRLRQQLIERKLNVQRKEWEQERKMWFEFLRSNLFEVKQKYQSVCQIYFLLAYIQNEVLNNKFKALYSLEEGRKHKGGIKYELLNYYYLREIEIKMQLEDKQKNEKKPVDVNKYYSFQIGFGKLQELMEESAYQHIAFWEMLKSDKASRSKIYEQGVKIHKKLQQISESYAKLIQLNSSNIHCLILYGNFMKVIVNSNQIYEKSQQACEMVKRTISQSFKIQSDIEKQKYGQNSVSAIVIISGQRSSIGVIKYASGHVGEILGYASHQLLGQNINILMPKFIGNMHDDVLRNYLELSQSQYDYVERLVPMIDVNNFMILARMLTKPLPNLLNGLELIGIFNSVLQASVNHPSQKPKYVLYRSDTGQVQALSQNFYNEFNYKINKIDQNNETSSEVAFSNLFIGVKESDITEGVRVRCKMVSRLEESGDVQQVGIELFQRLLIHYYSVDLKLLCFYNQKNYKNIESVQEIVHEPIEKGIILNSERDGDEAKPPKTERAAHDKAAKQKYLHQITKKTEVNTVQPTNLKVMRYWGYSYHIVILILAIVFLFMHSNGTTLNDYFSLTKNSGELMGDICELAFNSRLLQASAINQNTVDFAYCQGNLTVSLTSLQNMQFQIDSIYLNYGDYSNFQIRQWTIGTNNFVNYSAYNLDTATFDYVTIASTFQLQSMSSLNFGYVLLSLKTVTRPVTLMFKLRVNAIFQLIPAQTRFNQLYFNQFNTLFANSDKKQLLSLIGSLCGLAIMFIVAIGLGISVINSINNTIMLFGHIARFQLERQIQHCNSFLQIFYQDSYLVGLKKRQRISEKQHLSQFSVDDAKLGTPRKSPKSQRKSINNTDSEVKEQSTHGVIKANVSKIQFLEKELQLRTEGELMMSQTQQQNQNQLLRGQGDSSQGEVSIYEKLAGEKNTEKWTQSCLYMFLLVLYMSLFVGQYMLTSASNNLLLTQLGHLQTGYNNLNSIKLIKVYSLQASLDNSIFSSYPRLSDTLNSIYQDLYSNQRTFDTIAMPENTTLFPFYYTNICAPATISRLANSPYNKLYTYDSFDSSECEGLLQSVLGEGLRLGIVGYTQSLYNLSTMNSSLIFNHTNFVQSRKMQKYIQSPLRWFIGEHSNYITQIISFRMTFLTIYIVVIILITLFVCCQVWRRNINQLHDRLTMSRAMLSFIPVRVFVRNQKLTKQYEQYIGQLIE